MVARRAHNPKVVGSNPAPATRLKKAPFGAFCFLGVWIVGCLTNIDFKEEPLALFLCA